MLSSTCIAFIMLIATAGATRVAQQDKDHEVEVLHQSNPIVDTEGDCWRIPGTDTWMGQCCSSKCNGKSDLFIEATYSDCKVVRGEIFEKKSRYDYKCKEICTRKAEALVQLPDVGDMVDGVKGFFGFGDKKKSKKAATKKRYITKKGVEVTRTGGEYASFACMSEYDPSNPY